MYVIVLFFFKQKTAYEMRISDWSSDVCSSDLFPDMRQQLQLGSLYADVSAGISQRLLADRLIKRPSAGLTEGGAPLGSRGGMAARHLVGNRWMMIAEQPQNTGGTVVQFLDITAMKTAEQRRQTAMTKPHVSRFARED